MKENLQLSLRTVAAALAALGFLYCLPWLIILPMAGKPLLVLLVFFAVSIYGILVPPARRHFWLSALALQIVTGIYLISLAPPSAKTTVLAFVASYLSLWWIAVSWRN